MIRDRQQRPIGSTCLCLAGLMLSASRPAAAQAGAGTTNLVVTAGTPLRVALENRVRVTRVGQPITGTMVEAVFAYDRIVIPARTKVLGHLARFEEPGAAARVVALLGGDFTPLRRAVLEFDTLLLNEKRLPIRTVVASGTANVRRLVAAGAESPRATGVKAIARDEISGAREELKQTTNDALSAIRQPGKIGRLRDFAISRLPFHPTFLTQGTIYSAELVSPVSFGTATAMERAPAGTAPASSSILTARLVTPLDSAKTPRGTLIMAILTEPVFSADHQLILPEGTELSGAVTFTKRAEHFHRNGQLRFLFERVKVADVASATLLASLYSVQASGDAHLAVDHEGGTTINNSKLRFAAPALALFALSASTDLQGVEPGEIAAASTVEAGNVAGRGLGGWMGFGLIGAALSQVSRPVAVGLAGVGALRTVYSSVFGKGKEVSFPADTPIQVQLAPGPTGVK